jgi:nucleotide-binding universal stress UspA family protein
MRILIPTDFSDNARKALDYALTLFGDNEPEVVLLNTWQIPHTGVGMLVSIEDILKEESERSMDELVTALTAASNNAFPISGKVQPGSLSDVVRSLIRTEGYDYVVMGTLGADDVKKKLLGSNASNVVRSCPAPVIVVPMNTELKVPKKIAIATDFKGLQEKQLSPLSALVVKFNAKFEAVHVESEAIMAGAAPPQAWLEPFAGSRPEVVTVVSDNVAEGVDRYVRQNEVDLLAVIRHDYGFIEGLFHRSVSRKLSMHASCPMLIMPD